MNFSEPLPWYPGYALGGIIHEANLNLPLLQRKQRQLYGELSTLGIEKENQLKAATLTEEKQAITDEFVVAKEYKERRT